MYAVPFSIQFNNPQTNCSWDVLGILRFSASRRNKGEVKVHVSTGADFEHVADYTQEQIQSHTDYFFLAEWLEQYGYLEEMTGVEMLTRTIPAEIRQEEFNKDLLMGLGKVRIW